MVLHGVRDEGDDGNCRCSNASTHTCEEAAGHPVFLVPGDVYVAKK